MKTPRTLPFSIVSRGRLHAFRRPAVAGILNVTPDSFYDGGRYSTADAIVHRAQEIVAQGADMIDIGAASSRPGAVLPPPEEEAARLAEAVRLVRGALPEALISVDTCYALPARKAVEAGADMVNDIGGGDVDPQMFATVAELQVPYILMHGGKEHLAGAKRMADGDPVDEVVRFFSSRLDALYRMGVKDVWLDPGFGFAKDTEQNFALLDRLDELTELFREPLYIGLSRKRMIYNTLGTTADEAFNGTVALDALALDRGAAALRVHDVRPAVETVSLLYRNT
ncbi:MAG: dihydropteroate synthase [Bacteroidales bacterium]|nr:dihydropteroate synthase [Bacteroidales bacterium]